MLVVLKKAFLSCLDIIDVLFSAWDLEHSSQIPHPEPERGARYSAVKQWSCVASDQRLARRVIAAVTSLNWFRIHHCVKEFVYLDFIFVVTVHKHGSPHRMKGVWLNTSCWPSKNLKQLRKTRIGHACFLHCLKQVKSQRCPNRQCKLQINYCTQFYLFFVKLKILHY